VEKHHANGIGLGEIKSLFFGCRFHERIGFAQQQAATVSGFAIGGNRTAVGKTGKGIDGGFYQPVTGFAIHLGNQSETAAIFLKRWLIKPFWYLLVITHVYISLLLHIALELCQKPGKTPAYPAQRAGKYTGAVKAVQLREMVEKQG
jgi:hypothetical protein